MKQIAIETYTCTREYLVEVPKGETTDITGQRVLNRQDGVDEIPNSEKFVSSVGVVIRDLKPGEDEDFVLRRMEMHKAEPTKTDAELTKKRGRPRKIALDNPALPGIMDEETKQSKLDLLNNLL